MSLGIAARTAGLTVAGVLGRGDIGESAARLDAPALGWDRSLPPSDLVLLAVRDDAISEVCDRVAPWTEAPLVHLSGLATLDVLSGAQWGRGSFHPLQTLPTPEAGAGQLRGAGVAIAADREEALRLLRAFADELGMVPFAVAEEHRAIYHAAAAASANFVVTSLAIAHRLYEAAGVDPAVAERLTRAVVANVYAMGPAAALTGPIARGDVGTVEAHLSAVKEAAPDVLPGFRSLVAETARLAGTTALFEELAL